MFKWFLPLKIQINSQKTRFWKEKSVEDMVTLGPMPQATLVWCGSWIHNILNLMRVHTNVMIKMMYPRNFISHLWNSHVTYVSCNVQLFKLWYIMFMSFQSLEHWGSHWCNKPWINPSTIELHDWSNVGKQMVHS
jgi:hypothetical protein